MRNEPMMSIEDTDLIHRLLQRQENAWHEFVRRYQRLIYAQVARSAARLSIELAEAEREDICAQVFSALLSNDMRSLRSFDGRSKLSTWLTVVSRRVCIRELQKRRSDRQQQTLPENVKAQSVDGLSHMIRCEDQNRLRETMDALEAADREILQLYYDQNMCYQEISLKLGISVNTVGPKLTRAHDRLRKRLRWS